MSLESIATLLMSLSALIGTALVIYKARSERNKATADTESVNVDTIARLSKQLGEAYVLIGDLRKDMDDLACHRDYEEYLLRGIARLTASLAANELSVPWIPIKYDEFKQREMDRENKKEGKT